MGIIDRLFGARPGVPGDQAVDDDFLDKQAWREESGGPALFALAARPGMVAGGRVAWREVFKGVPNVVYMTGWEKRGAPVLAPVGVLWHWTAGKPTAKRTAPSLQICINGRPDVPGPLVQLLVGSDGVIYVIASGRANHAGLGHQPLLKRIREGLPPAGSAKALGLANTGGSGGALIGVEVENDGKAPFTAAQLVAIGNITKAVRLRLGFNDAQAGAWHHRAWTNRKIDYDDAKAAQVYALARKLP